MASRHLFENMNIVSTLQGVVWGCLVVVPEAHDSMERDLDCGEEGFEEAGHWTPGTQVTVRAAEIQVSQVAVLRIEEAVEILGTSMVVGSQGTGAVAGNQATVVVVGTQVFQAGWRTLHTVVWSPPIVYDAYLTFYSQEVGVVLSQDVYMAIASAGPVVDRGSSCLEKEG
jgi:hypothetical protein